MTLEQLNNKYYTLFSDLYSNRAKLPPKQYDIMAKALNQAYTDELVRVFDQIELDTANENYLLKLKIGNETPKRGFFWRWNRYAKELRKNYFASFENTLAEISKNTGLLKADTLQLQSETEQAPAEETITTATTLPNVEPTGLLEQKPKG